MPLTNRWNQFIYCLSSYAPTAGWLIPNLAYRSHAVLRDKIVRGSWLVQHSFSRPVRLRMPRWRRQPKSAT